MWSGTAAKNVHAAQSDQDHVVLLHYPPPITLAQGDMHPRQRFPEPVRSIFGTGMVSPNKAFHLRRIGQQLDTHIADEMMCLSNTGQQSPEPRNRIAPVSSPEGRPIRFVCNRVL